MTYLVIRLATLGNVAMTVPVIASLSRRYPNDRFIIAGKKELSAMFASFPNVTYHEVNNHLDWKGVFALWRELRGQVDAVRRGGGQPSHAPAPAFDYVRIIPSEAVFPDRIDRIAEP